MNKLKQWWATLERNKQNQILMLAMATALGLYGLYFIGINKEIKHAENMINRTKNRIKLRDKDIKEPKESPSRLKEKLDKLSATLEERQEKLKSIQGTLIPLDSMEHIQQMRLAISQLAEHTGMVIRKMEGHNRRRTSAGMGSIGKDFMESQIKNRYGRPLIKITSTVDFHGLLAFLDGLNKLEYNVSPVNLKIISLVPDGLDAERALERQQFLQLQIVLAL